MLKILLLAGNPIFFGYGHYIRCLNIKKYLETHDTDISADVHLFSSNQEPIFYYEKYNLIILDARDSSFPINIAKQCSHKKMLALDNQGAGRKQAHFYLDTLPHFSMNTLEWKKSLQFVLLPFFLSHQKNKTLDSFCNYSTKNISKKSYLSTFKNIHHANEINIDNIELLQKKFHEQNISLHNRKKKKLNLYFWQVFF